MPDSRDGPAVINRLSGVSSESRRGPMLNRLRAGVVDASRRHASLVMLVGFLLAGLSCAVAAMRLGVSTDTDQMFSESLTWRRNAIEFNKDFPQFRDLLVAVIDARE